MLLVAVAALARHALGESFGTTSPFVTFYPVGLLAAVLCGLGPGVLATLLSALCAAYFFAAPPRLGLGSVVDVIVFSTTALSINLLVAILDRRHRLAAEESRAAYAYARGLLEAGLDPLATISPEGRITDVNRAAEEATGVPRSALIGCDFADCFMEPERARAGYREVFARGQVTDYPLAIRHVSGKVTEVLYNAALYRDERGAVAGVFAAARDITARKRAEDALRESEQKLLKMFRANPSVIMISTAKDHRFLEVNDTFERVSGYRREEVIRRTPEELELWVDPRQVEELAPELLAKGAPRNVECRLRTKRGEVRTFLFSAEAIELAGEPCILTAGRDITERKRAEEELARHRDHLEQMVEQRTAEIRTANQGLESANKELETFAYSVSHDLRAPLRAVDGFSRILLEEYAARLDPEGLRLINTIRDGTWKMARMIDDILAFSRMGRQEVSPRAIDMDGLVRAVLKELEPALAGREIRLEIHPLPASRGDPRMIQRLWSNLLDNAIKFTRSRPQAAIQVGAQTGDKETVYYVKDNGVGFDMQYGGKLFGVFQRLHSQEDFPGTGIGLAIVQRIVARHGGRVWAEGKVDEGATFYFALPEGSQS